MLQILLDNGFVLMLRRDSSLASLISSMGEVRPAARVVTVVVFTTNGYKFETAQGTKCISFLTGRYLSVLSY